MLRDDRGSVTAEMAAALPVLVLLLAVALSAVGAVTSQLRCVDAAREGARAAARGEAPARATAVARQVAPPGSKVAVKTIGTTDGDAVVVTVNSRVPLLGRLLSSVAVGAQATALVEPEGPP